MLYMNWDVTWCYYTLPHKVYRNTDYIGNGLARYLREQISDTLKRTWVLYESQKDRDLFWSQVQNHYTGLLGLSNDWGRFLALPRLALPRLATVDTFAGSDVLKRFTEEPDHDPHTWISAIIPDEQPNKTIKPDSYSLIWNHQPAFVKVFRREKYPYENQDTILICFPTPHKEAYEGLCTRGQTLYEYQLRFDSWLTNNYFHRYTIHTGIQKFFDFRDNGDQQPDYGNCFLTLHPLGNELFRRAYLKAFPPKDDLESFLTPEDREDRFHWLVFADWLEERKLEKQFCELIRFFLGDCSIAF